MYKKLTDEEILNKWSEGDENALDFLLTKYKTLANKISRSYFLIGAENDDVLQEAMLGLYSACRNFKKGAHASFKKFATLCITRAVQSAVKKANTMKNKYLNESYSLSSQGTVILDSQENNDDEVCLYIPSNILPPEDIILAEEREKEIENIIDENLSKKEKSVLNLYLKGLTYIEIAEKLNENVKSVDNAISRTKRKLEDLLK